LFALFSSPSLPVFYPCSVTTSSWKTRLACTPLNRRQLPKDRRMAIRRQPSPTTPPGTTTTMLTALIL